MIQFFIFIMVILCSWIQLDAMDGTLDTTFSGDGFATVGALAVGESGIPVTSPQVALQSTNKSIVAFASLIPAPQYSANVAVTRYNSDGTVDTTFGTGGQTIVDIGTNQLFITGCTVLSDDSIIIVGFEAVGMQTKTFVTHLTSEGDLDLAYGDDGIATPLSETSSSELILGATNNIGDDTIFLTGTQFATPSSQGTFITMLLDTSGALDDNFGTDGVVLTNVYTGTTIPSPTFPSSNNLGWAVAQQPDGNIVVVGQSVINGFTSPFDTVVTLIRYTPTGELDSSFGNGGIVTTNVFSNNTGNIGNDVNIQADGKIIVVGIANGDRSIVGYPGVLVVTRYNTDGSVDSSFGTNGFTAIGQTNLSFSTYKKRIIPITTGGGMVIAANSGIITGSGPSQTENFDIIVARLQEDGSPDLSFGDSGIFSATLPPSYLFSGGIDMVEQMDGKLIIVCLSNPTDTPDTFVEDYSAIIARLNNTDTPLPPLGPVTLEKIFCCGNNRQVFMGHRGNQRVFFYVNGDTCVEKTLCTKNIDIDVPSVPPPCFLLEAIAAEECETC